MATIIEKDSLINLISYAESIIILRVEPSDERDEIASFLNKQKRWMYSVSPEEIDIEAEAPKIQEIIEKYKDYPLLPNFQ